MRDNPNPREREIVKIRRATTDGANYLIHARRRVGMQYRDRRDVPAQIREPLDQGAREIFAFAFVDRNGRWILDELAPEQGW